MLLQHYGLHTEDTLPEQGVKLQGGMEARAGFAGSNARLRMREVARAPTTSFRLDAPVCRRDRSSQTASAEA